MWWLVMSGAGVVLTRPVVSSHVALDLGIVLYRLFCAVVLRRVALYRAVLCCVASGGIVCYPLLILTPHCTQ